MTDSARDWCKLEFTAKVARAHEFSDGSRSLDLEAELGGKYPNRINVTTKDFAVAGDMVKVESKFLPFGKVEHWTSKDGEEKEAAKVKLSGAKVSRIGVKAEDIADPDTFGADVPF